MKKYIYLLIIAFAFGHTGPAAAQTTFNWFSRTVGTQPLGDGHNVTDANHFADLFDIHGKGLFGNRKRYQLHNAFCSLSTLLRQMASRVP